VAVVFGLVSSAILAMIVIVATRSSSTSAPDPRPKVAIVGDSITEQGESALKAGLSGHWRLRIDGRAGFTVAQQLPAARDLGDWGPSQVVVNLGTNDVMKGSDLGQSADELREVVAAFPEASCVHLVTLNEGIRLAGTSYAARSAELNQVMAELAAADPRVHLIDWSSVVAADEASSDADDPILNDTVHPTSRGQRVLTGLYAEALAACPAPS
jgi:lysophospholipase L1-like esterase